MRKECPERKNTVKSRIFYEEFDSFYYYSGGTQNWNMQGLHFHKNYEIILVMSDGAGICIDNREYEVDKGTLFVINNREYHKTSGVKGQDYNRYVVMFDPDRLRAVSQAMDYDFFKYFEHRPEGFIHKLYLNKEHLGEVIGLFEKVEKCSVSTQQGMDGVVLNLAIMELLVYINRLYDFFSEKSIDDAVMDAFEGESGPVHGRWIGSGHIAADCRNCHSVFCNEWNEDGILPVFGERNFPPGIWSGRYCTKKAGRI